MTKTTNYEVVLKTRLASLRINTRQGLLSINFIASNDACGTDIGYGQGSIIPSGYCALSDRVHFCDGECYRQRCCGCSSRDKLNISTRFDPTSCENRDGIGKEDRKNGSRSPHPLVVTDQQHNPRFLPLQLRHGLGHQALLCFVLFSFCGHVRSAFCSSRKRLPKKSLN